MVEKFIAQILTSVSYLISHIFAKYVYTGFLWLEAYSSYFW